MVVNTIKEEEFIYEYHISAQEVKLADIVLLPGESLRAKYIAETFLKIQFVYQ